MDRSLASVRSRVLRRFTPDALKQYGFAELLAQAFAQEFGDLSDGGGAGVDGVDGEAGRDGVVGLDGQDGEDGAVGLQGTPGAPGVSGSDGAAGQDGSAGLDGQEGEDGVTFPGAPGAQGSPGADGLDGRDGTFWPSDEPEDFSVFFGERGLPGADGAVGPAGPYGLSGPPGASGEDAEEGVVFPGERGSSGVEGAAGPAGADGVPGPAGVPGEDAEDDTVFPGPSGAPGTPGRDGASWPAEEADDGVLFVGPDLDADLAALAKLGGVGYAARVAAGTWAQRTLTGTANQVAVTNGDGTVGDPVFSTPQDLHTAATVQFGSGGLGTAAPTAGNLKLTKNVIVGNAAEKTWTLDGAVYGASGSMWFAPDEVYGPMANAYYNAGFKRLAVGYCAGFYTNSSAGEAWILKATTGSADSSFSWTQTWGWDQAGTMKPFVSNTYDIGTTLLRAKHVFAAGDVHAAQVALGGVAARTWTATLYTVYASSGAIIFAPGEVYGPASNTYHNAGFKRMAAGYATSLYQSTATGEVWVLIAGTAAADSAITFAQTWGWGQGGVMKPFANNTSDIGTSSLGIKDLFIAGDIKHGTLVWSLPAGSGRLARLADIPASFPSEDGEDPVVFPGQDGVAGTAGAPGGQGPAGAQGSQGAPGDDAEEAVVFPGRDGMNGAAGAAGAAGRDGAVWPVEDPEESVIFVGPPGASGSAPGGGSAVAVDVDFGAAYNHLASAVVTGQAWVTASSVIVATPEAEVGLEDECAVAQFHPVVGARVIGVGFTLTVFTPVRVKGTYTFNCVGV